MSSHKRRSLALNFVDRHGLWSEAQARAAAAVEKAISQKNLELVRFSFPDQHGILRGKTLVAAEAVRALRSGVTMTSTLFAKDTSHRTVFPVFEAGAGMDLPEMGGAGNFVMIADPETFRVLPWAENTGWVLCDCYFPNGKKVPIATRGLYREALTKLAEAGFDYLAGLEVEFHLFKIEDLRLAPETLDLAGRTAAGQPYHARLSVPHRGPLRSGRAHSRRVAKKRRGARPAAAIARG